MGLHLNVAKLNNNELVAFGEGLNNAVKNLQGIDSVLKPFQKQLNDCTNAVNNVLEKTKAKAVSDLLKTEDNTRDNLIIGLNKLIDACSYHPDNAVVQAATELNTVIDKLGSSIQKKGYDAESTLLNTILTDLKGDYLTQVTIINADAIVKALDKSQNRFAKLRSEQLIENAEINEIVSMSAIRREFEASIRLLLSVLPVLYQLNPAPEFKDAIGVVKQLIAKFK